MMQRAALFDVMALRLTLVSRRGSETFSKTAAVPVESFEYHARSHRSRCSGLFCRICCSSCSLGLASVKYSYVFEMHSTFCLRPWPHWLENFESSDPVFSRPCIATVSKVFASSPKHLCKYVLSICFAHSEWQSILFGNMYFSRIIFLARGWVRPHCGVQALQGDCRLGTTRLRAIFC